MKNSHPFTKIVFISLLSVLAFFPTGYVFGQTNAVDFSLTQGTSSANYSQFKAGGAPSKNQPVVGFEVDITSIGGLAVDASPMAAFCIEIAETIGNGSYEFDAGFLYEAAAGRAGEAGTASLNIQPGGIGQLRAARVRYLFDNFYESSTLSSWTQTSTTPNVHAFQLSLWELTHDEDFSLSNRNGSLYINRQSISDTTTMRNNAISLAQSWLTRISGAGITDSYESTKYDVISLMSDTGNTDGKGYQDIVMGSLKGTTDHKTFSTLLPIPEPSSSLLALTASLLVLRRRR